MKKEYILIYGTRQGSNINVLREDFKRVDELEDRINELKFGDSFMLVFAGHVNTEFVVGPCQHVQKYKLIDKNA
jgi:hypothetical protein